jgi:FkbM family methyltransferase
LNIEEELISIIRRLCLTDVHLVHVGAHLVEESATYNNELIKLVSWIEANPEHFLAAKSLLNEYTNQEVFQAAIYRESGTTRTFYVASNDGMSSSLLQFDRHRGFFPNVRTQREFKVETVTLDDFFTTNFPSKPYPEAIVLDIQGAELDALQGSEKIIENAKIIVSEISRYKLYRNQGLFEEINRLLEGHGYLCVSLDYNVEFEYGDAIWVKKDLAKKLDFTPMTGLPNRNPRAGILGNKFLLLHRLRLLETALMINRWFHSQQKLVNSEVPSKVPTALTKLRKNLHALLLKRGKS